MKIGILSDSHKKVALTNEAINHLKALGCEILIHAGDLEIVENLELLKNSGLIYTSVFGNNDNGLLKYQNDYKIHKEPYYFKIKELKFKLMHLPYFMNNDTDIIIFGHTHNFETRYENGTLYINSGEVCARNKPLTECVMLEISEAKYQITYNFRNPNEHVWNKKEITYDR
ncbi:MAG: YfcE family phosphodiesterase [Arcobacter sp.]|nr:YfcE family phosphodiesterase [Arcobacter sp.]